MARLPGPAAGHAAARIACQPAAPQPTIGAAGPAEPTAVAQPPAAVGVWSRCLTALRSAIAAGAAAVWADARLALLSVVAWLAGPCPLPISIWLAGSLALATWRMVGLLRLARIAHRAAPADAETLALVQAAAARLGLRCPPRVRMTAASLSPMIVAIAAPILLLPQQLWEALPLAARRTIIYHELAHVRRRDHWVRRLDVLIGLLFWFHPIAWLARQRVREEAELCCDAWVTWHLPRFRRAYADALLATQELLFHSRTAMPSAGIGMSTVRAGRFARRLTMLMTETRRPRLTRAGVALAGLLGLAAWGATPVWSCPPEEAPTPTPPAAVSPPAPQPLAESPPAAPELASLLIESGEEGAVEPAVFDEYTREIEHALGEFDSQIDHLSKLRIALAESGVGTGDELRRELEVRRAAIEKVHAELMAQREQLHARLHALRDQLRTQVHAGVAALPRVATPRAFVRPFAGTPAPIAPLAPVARPAVPGQPAPRAFLLQPPGTPRLAPPAHGLFTPPPPGNDAGAVVARVYRLPQGKREALFELLKRNDVPIRVATTRDGVRIFATPQQHEVLGAFVAIINPDGEQAEASVGRGARARSGGGSGSGMAVARPANRGGGHGGQSVARNRHDADDDDDDGDDEARTAQQQRGAELFSKAMAAHRAGSYADAVKLFKQCAESGYNRATSLYNMACGLALSDHADEAFAALERAIGAGFDDVNQIRNDDDLKPLHKDPRFKKLLKAAKSTDDDDDD
ncbi:MAG: M56 family metallopeptidase [Phycisphaerae bacterium]